MKLSCTLLLILATLFIPKKGHSCSPLGDQVTYGTNNIWIGYVYGASNLTNYKGYITTGTPGNLDFHNNFGGDNVTLLVNGCNIVTENFSIRYKLIKTFTDGDYEFELAADDGFRFSIDGGATWVMDQWNINPLDKLKYLTLHLNGTYNLVFEYFEVTGRNTVSFNVKPSCLSSENPTVYGTDNVWKAYVYRGLNFDLLKGSITEGTPTNPNFDETYGSSTGMFATSSCPIKTDTFTVRYMLQKDFTPGNYIMTVGGDDGYRLSLDGGVTWIIDEWNYQGFKLSTISLPLSGIKNMVIEYYEGKGGNEISFSLSTSPLPIILMNFNGRSSSKNILLNWSTTTNSTTDNFSVERSDDGKKFISAGIVKASAGHSDGEKVSYDFSDEAGSATVFYYRLKMVDLSGAISYSKTLRLSKAGSSGSLDIYPTFSDGSIYISTSEKIENASIIVYDYSGRELFSKSLGSIPAGSVIPVSFSAKIANAGMYLVRILNNNSSLETKKIVIRK